MSKETFIGGDYIETTGGNNLNYGKEGIENIGSQVIQNGIESGVSYGINRDAPAFNNTQIDFYVDVFRSKAQIPDNFGLKDVEYKGTFGFDRYNEATSGKGKQSLDGFEEMGFNGNKYYVPWLCLWPPKKHLETVTEIDKTYSPVTNAVLTFKICEGIVKKGNAKFVISSNHPNLKIDGTEKVEKQGTINSTVNVTISCEGILERDVTVEVKNEQGNIIGKLKVVKNNTIYIANTKFITVMEEEKATTSIGKQQKREAEKTKFQSLIKDVIVYLNKNSLNQSLIYVKGSVEDIFVIEKGKIIRDKGEGAYSSSVTDPYFDGINESGENKNGGEKKEKELDKAVRELYNALNKNYKKFRKNTYFCEDTVNQTGNQLFKDYEDKYKAYLNSIGGNEKVGGHIKDNKTLYVFVDKGMPTLPVNGMEYYGYTYGADNCAFIFNKHVMERKFGTFAHEIAHSLGLDHTFELNEKEYRKNKILDEKIAEKEKILKEKTKIEQTTSNNVIKMHEQFIQFVADERDLDKLINFKKDIIFKTGKHKYYEMIDERIVYVKNTSEIEKNSKTSSNEVNNVNVNISGKMNEEIQKLKKEKIANSNKYIDVSISETQENFMDYDYDSSGAPNANFDHRSFWKWQWDSLHNSNYINKKEI